MSSKRTGIRYAPSNSEFGGGGFMTGKRKVAGCKSSTSTTKKIKRQDDQDRGTYTPQLPDLVVCQILQLLTTKLAFRASILSKQWARVLSLVPVVDFDDEKSCDREKRAKFHRFLRSCLVLRKKDEHELDKFRLSMRYGGGAKIIDKWLNFAVERNVKELSIMLSTATEEGFSGQYKLSPMVFINAKSLTSLNLKNVRLRDDDISANTISLPFLKTMSLEKIDLCVLGFIHSISRCPSIEYLSLTACVLWNAEVSSSSLKFLEVTNCRGTSEYKKYRSVVFKVEAINLESFRLRANSSSTISSGNIDIFSCRAVRCLEIFHAGIDRQLFDEGFNSRFPLLESLTILYSSCQSYTILNHQLLKHLVIDGYFDVIRVLNIDTPNLMSLTFHLTDYLLRSNFLNAPNLVEATINFRLMGKTENATILNFLGKFDCCRKLSLAGVRGIAKDLLIIPEKTRKICSSPLPSLKHLKVMTTETTATDVPVLKDSLLWMAPNLGSLYIDETEVFADHVVD